MRRGASFDFSAANRMRAQFVHDRTQKRWYGLGVKLEGALESMQPLMSGRSAAW
jgi:hypothetical protein